MPGMHGEQVHPIRRRLPVAEINFVVMKQLRQLGLFLRSHHVGRDANDVDGLCFVCCATVFFGGLILKTDVARHDFEIEDVL